MYINLRKFNLAVVVPAYNVADTIELVLNELPHYLHHIIVVDDASLDKTTELVQAFSKRDKRVVLIRHEHNQGVGGAMRTGFRKALEFGAQVVVKIDGDHQMDPAHIPALVTPLLEG
ncbi:MAG: glycosyltransferase family 2 protein, partial [Anaerolineales bacterium]